MVCDHPNTQPGGQYTGIKGSPALAVASSPQFGAVPHFEPGCAAATSQARSTLERLLRIRSQLVEVDRKPWHSPVSRSALPLLRPAPGGLGENPLLQIYSRPATAPMKTSLPRPHPSWVLRSIFSCCISSNPYIFPLREREQYDFPELPAECPCFLPSLLLLLQMASIVTVGDAWRAQIRRKGHKSISETFPTKVQAVAWARKVEAEMDARRFNDTRGLANITLKELIDWYFEEIGADLGRTPCPALRRWQAKQ